MRMLMILTLGASLSMALGCDNSPGDVVILGTGGNGGGGGDAGMGGMGGMAGMGGMGGEGGMGGGATARAEAFCTDFEATCTYGGDNYADRSDCLTSFDGYEAARKDCVEEHMGFAEMGDPDLHCGHASGAPPCGA